MLTHPSLIEKNPFVLEMAIKITMTTDCLYDGGACCQMNANISLQDYAWIM